MREALEEYSVACELILVGNGALAIDFIDSFIAREAPCPDLVILDLNLPKRPGRDILQHMRASSQCDRIPIVVLSSSDSQREREEAAALGASHYIRKPSRLAEFLKLGGVFRDIIRGQSS